MLRGHRRRSTGSATKRPDRRRQRVGSGMRALTVVTIVMGVMILAGTGVLVAVIAHRIFSPAPGGASLAGGAATAGAPTAGAAPVSLVLDEPAGTRNRARPPAG